MKGRGGLAAGTAILVALAMAASAGAGGSRDFTRADLPRVNFKPSDAPPGTHYLAFSGPRLLERQGNLTRILRELRSRGFRADFGAQFEARSRQAPIAFFESVALLFEDREGARRSIDFLRRFQERALGAQRIGAGGLGERAWGLRGKFAGFKVVVYGWRIGNLIQVATLSPLHSRQLRPDPAHATLRFARRLEALAKR